MPSSVRDHFKGVEQIGANGGKTCPDEKLYSQPSELGEQKPTEDDRDSFSDVGSSTTMEHREG